jgi:hypothetical protein
MVLPTGRSIHAIIIYTNVTTNKYALICDIVYIFIPHVFFMKGQWGCSSLNGNEVVKMARQARGLSVTGFYHMVFRGINRQHLFEDESDFLYFLESLKR